MTRSGQPEGMSNREMKDLGCKKTHKLIALLPGNDLPADLDQPVRDHLARCPLCQRELGEHLRVRSALSRAAEAFRADSPVDAAFFAAMKRQILHEVNQNEVPRVLRQSSLRLNLARAMTAAALVLLTVYLVPPMFESSPELPDGGLPGSGASDWHPRFDDRITYDLNTRWPNIGLQGQGEMQREVDLEETTLQLPNGRILRWVETQPKPPSVSKGGAKGARNPVDASKPTPRDSRPEAGNRR